MKNMTSGQVTVFWVVREHRSPVLQGQDHVAICTDRDTAFRIRREQLVCKTDCCVDHAPFGYCRIYVEEEQVELHYTRSVAKGKINYNNIITQKMWQRVAQRYTYRADVNTYYEDGLLNQVHHR